ncbi:MAG: hypothetical protein AAGA53_16190 [Pseudomonadota bacterium]
MANYEGLIRGALAAKDATSSEVRRIVYQSSRNALKRLIEENRSLTVEAAVNEQRALEDAIQRVEEEFTLPQVEQVAVDPTHEDPLFELKQILAEDSEEFSKLQAQPQPAPVEPEQPARVEPPQVDPSTKPFDQLDNDAVFAEIGTNFEQVKEPVATETVTDEFSDHENLPLEFARRRRSQRFFIWLLATLGIIAVLAWLAYYLFVAFSDGSIFGLDGGQSAQNPNNLSVEGQSADYITILEPADLSTLVTANRGQAQLINELNLEMVRLVSVRNDDDPTRQAVSFLIRFKPGVIEQISGKNVTVEIYAKSGAPSPAQFILKCNLGSVDGCGRKRFRVGIQPEALIFGFQMPQNADPNGNYHIAINTDTTENAATTGRGDALDIVYVRLRAN